MRSQRGCVPGHDTDTAVIKDDPEVLPMFEKAMQDGEGGRPKKGSMKLVDNINRFSSTGTSKAYTLSRLQKDNPEIAHHRRQVDTIDFVSC